MRKYLSTVFCDMGDKAEEWTEWAKEHVADMIKLPGFIGCQAFRARPDFSFAHAEVLPTMPSYNLMTFYEHDEQGLEFLTTNSRPTGAGPAAETRSFPSPLGPRVGETFLWEAISPEYQAVSERPKTARYFVTALTNTGDKSEEWAQWCKDHVATMIKMPTHLGSRAYRSRPDFSYGHPETFATRPDYDLLTLYEVNEEGVKLMTTARREVGTPPQGGSRPFPGPLGPHVGDTYLWEAVSPHYRAIRD